jgi:cell division protein FtsQ
VKSAGRKSRGRGISWQAVGRVAAAVAVVGAAAFLMDRTLRSSQFWVQRIAVRGNTRLASGEIVALLEGVKGQHVFAVDLEHWRTRVLGSPWVAEARLRRVLPHTIEVALVERSPLATARIRDGLFLMDRSGAVIDEYGPQYADIDLPIIDGLLPNDSDTPQARARIALVRHVLDSLSGHDALLKRVSQIDVSDPRNAIVILADDRTRVQLGHTAFAERLASYLELAPALQSRVPEMDYVDLRFEPRVFVHPLAKGR